MAENEDSEESQFRLRSYQEEMLAASLRGNVIVKVRLDHRCSMKILANKFGVDGHRLRQDGNVCEQLAYHQTDWTWRTKLISVKSNRAC